MNALNDTATLISGPLMKTTRELVEDVAALAVSKSETPAEVVVDEKRRGDVNDDCVAPTTSGSSKRDKMRWGKWTKEEEAYTTRLIADFSAGLLTDVDNGTTMRCWLSIKLNCCPMRISKKFVGEQSIGKRMFERNENRINDMSDEEKLRRATEVKKLYDEFCESWVREEKERLENKANGSRKRKRNKSAKKDANCVPAPSATKLPTTPSTLTLNSVVPTSLQNPSVLLKSVMMKTKLNSIFQRPLSDSKPAESFSTKAASANSVALPKVSSKASKTEAKVVISAPSVCKAPKAKSTTVTCNVPNLVRKSDDGVSPIVKSNFATKKAQSHDAVASQTQNLHTKLASRSKSLSFDLSDPFGRVKEPEFDLYLDFKGCDFDIMNEQACWIPETVCNDASTACDPFGLSDVLPASLASETSKSLNHLPGLEQMKTSSMDSDLVESPASVMDYYSEPMWPLGISSYVSESSDVFLNTAPMLYDCLF
jgi:hypothetical protein